MNRTLILTSICIALMMLPDVDLQARGFGGGGRGGGSRGGGGRSFGGGGRGGGGFSGGMNRSGGGFNRGGGGGMSRGSSSGGMSRGPSGFGSSGMNRGSSGFSSSGTGRSPGRFGAGGRGTAGPGGGRASGGGNTRDAGNRFSSPSSNQLGNFLGLPSDGGLHGLGSAGGAGGPASGLGVRPGEGAGRPGAGAGGVGGPDSGLGVRPGAGAGRPGVGAGGVGGPASGVGVRPGAGAGGFNRVTPTERYNTASNVRNNYNHWGTYSSAWYRRYPGAWYATGWATGYAWNACTWDTMAGYYGYGTTQPMYYDYGNNVTYDGNNVYVNGQDAGTSEEYYDQASELASTGSQSEASQDGDWMPLGVFALTQTDQKESDVSIQLAVNKQGVIRGNYTDQAKNQNQVIQGSVDKEQQKAAFTVGDNSTNVYETGLYNLTKDEAPILLHLGKDQTQQLLLVRLKKDDR